MHRHQAAAVGEHRLDLHHWNKIGDAVHHVSLGQGGTRLLGNVFDCLPGTCAIKGDG